MTEEYQNPTSSEKDHSSEVTFNEFAKAWQIFSGDLKLVHATRLKPQSPFSRPLPHYNENPDHHKNHNYNLTQLQGETEEEFIHKLSQIKVLAVGCMDWRFANALYDRAQRDESSHDPLHHYSKYRPEEVMLVTVGGGIVQDAGEREDAIQTIIKYVAQKAPQLEKVLATGHCNRCGALAHWTNAGDGHVCPELGTIPGKPEEQSGMDKLVRRGMLLMSQFITSTRVRVECLTLQLAKPDIGPGEIPQVVSIPVSENGESLSVESLKKNS